MKYELFGGERQLRGVLSSIDPVGRYLRLNRKPEYVRTNLASETQTHYYADLLRHWHARDIGVIGIS